MERDPVRFVWRTTPGLHVALVALVLVILPLVWLGLDLTGAVVDHAVGGMAFTAAEGAPLLRLAVTPPPWIHREPIVLFEGTVLAREVYAVTAPAALMAAALLVAVLLVLAAALQTAIGRSLAAELRRIVLDAILASRPAARDEARQVASLAGETLARQAGGLGSALLTPLLTGGLLAVALLYTLSVDWRLAAAALIGIGLVALVWPRRLEAVRRGAQARLGEGAAHRRAFVDLVRRLPAVRAHGAGAQERARLLADLERQHGPVGEAERRLALIDSLCGLAVAATIVGVLGVAAVYAPALGVSPGASVAASAAAGLGVWCFVSLARWSAGIADASVLFEEIARQLGAMSARARGAGSAPLPGAGTLVARSLAAYDAASGARVADVDFSIAFPAHVAVIGEAGAGARVLAGLIGGQLEPTAGSLTFGGVEIAAVPPAERSRRIGFSGGETILIAGSLRQNLVYGAPDPDAPDMEQRLLEAVSVAGLDAFVHARGLAGTIDPAREPKLAAAIVEARRKVRTALRDEGLEGCVDPFDRARYNTHATIAENILFGVPVGDTFRDANLPSHPFVRAIVEADELTKPLVAMGVAIARSMVEIFADLPDDHPLFERFAFYPASERGYYEDLVARRDQPRRGADRGADRERLIGLALRYNENRHRLGLLDDALEARLVRARASFAQLLPTSLQPSIEFYDPDRLCAAASLQDNLLFGRIAHDRAGADTQVLRVVRRVLTERGLDQELFRVGLDRRLDVRGEGLVGTELAAVDLARCLVRRPDVLVVERAFEGLTQARAEALLARLRRAMIGRGLVVLTPSLSGTMDDPPLDAVLHFSRGGVTVSQERRHAQAA